MARRRENKALARGLLRQEQERRPQRRRRSRIIAVTAGVAALVVAVVVIGVVVQNQRSKTHGPTPPGTVAGALAIPVGERTAPVTLTVFEDFRCPSCKQFEDAFGDMVRSLVDAGKLRVEYHIATVIDGNDPGTSGSKVAGNAAACAFVAGRFRPFHDVLYTNQPPETEDGFTGQRVLDLAERVDGLDTATFRSCVSDGTYRPWLTRVQRDFDHRFAHVTTPTLLLDGRLVFGGNLQRADASIATPEKFQQTVTQLAAKHSSPSPTPP
ncbi:MAG: thioredoxin domain-containing protein [Streptosporangiales bacterium]|nr:thioredoxin domain-containing protein [Streptosporangiales bacterium]MBO0891060.1 thioredoxin domain-containing protein [Acidothermales bacterium]